MSDNFDIKSIDLEIKNDEKGEVAAVFSIFDKVDSDGDIVKAGSIKSGFKSGDVPMVWAHKWDMPIGKGQIEQDDDKATFKGQFFMDTESGKEAYNLVKAMGELQQWSFGFKVDDSEYGKFKKDGSDEEEDVRFLKGLTVYEVSPVLVGANQETYTMAIKSNTELLEELSEEKAVMTTESMNQPEPEEEPKPEVEVEVEVEEAPAEGDIPGEANAVKDILIKRQLEKLEAMKAITDDTSEQEKINNQIEQLKLKMTKVKAATGGLMRMSIGGQAALSEKYDRRGDYQAYAEGDMVEDESLMRPTGMNESAMGTAEADMEMMAEEDAEFGDMDAVVDTSALSEEEEKVVDDAVEMFPELEGIIPKIVATEFTDDGEVEGPGTGTSDSIPALLSDGEFVFTAKAVKHIGVDKLRKMMKDAEAAYDSGMQSQEADAAMAE